MHPVNKMVSLIGYNLWNIRRKLDIPWDYKCQYNRQLSEVMKNNRGFKVFKELNYDVGSHPQTYVDFECEFAARNLAKRNPKMVLDIGSYRHFIIGLMASYKVTTIDIRERVSSLNNETVLTCDAKQLDIPFDSFDAIVSLCALEHFGLGRYGDEFDIDADKKAFNEMIRVLKPGGILIFTTTITKGCPSIVFNAQRIYNYEMIRTLCERLELVEENFFSHKIGKFCSLEQVTNVPSVWDVYCGCWIKDI